MTYSGTQLLPISPCGRSDVAARRHIAATAAAACDIAASRLTTTARLAAITTRPRPSSPRAVAASARRRLAPSPRLWLSFWVVKNFPGTWGKPSSQGRTLQTPRLGTASAFSAEVRHRSAPLTEQA
uniref:Uncharacterized protein n=1 Tax=Oryza punctata TaxID=4537 RepID=A0A0E0LTA9_ORYPU